MFTPRIGLLKQKSAPALASGNWQTPSTQASSTANFTHEWQLQEPTGAYASGGSGSSLTVNGTPLRAAPVYGKWDGTSYSARVACEFQNAGTEYLEASANTVMDSDESSVGVRAEFRCLRPSTGMLFGKKTAAAAGFYGEFNASGHFIATVTDGTTTRTATVAANHLDGALHYVDVVIDWTADELRVRTDCGTATTDISAVNSISNTDNFRLGHGNNVAAPRYLQITYASGVEGVDAESLDTQDFWTHAQDPGGAVTNTRTSTVALPVEADKVAFFSGESTVAQTPIGYSKAHGGRAVYIGGARQNLLPYSEDLTTWSVGGGVVRTGNHAVGPHGFKAAVRLSKTAGTQYSSIWDNTDTLVAGKVYTLSGWIYKVSGSGPNMEVRNAGDTAEVAIRFFTGAQTGVWEHFQLPFVATANAAHLVRLRPSSGIAAETAECYFAHIQVNEGEGVGAMALTHGAAVNMAAQTYIGPAELPMDNARIEVSWARSIRDTGNVQGVFGTNDASDAVDIRVGTDNLQAAVIEAGNTVVDTLVGAHAYVDTVHTSVLRYDSDAGGLGEDALRTGSLNDSVGAPDTTNSTWTAAAEKAWILGGTQAAGTQLDGWIQSFTVYADAGTIPATPEAGDQIGVDFWTDSELIDFDVEGVGGFWATQDFTTGWTRDPANVARVDPNLEITVPSGLSAGGEIATVAANYQYGSYRFNNVQTSSVYGTVLGCFYYFDDNNEIDIEILSRENANAVMHCVIHEEIGDTHRFVPLGFDPSAAPHDYRFDWYPASDPGGLRVEFFVDGIRRAVMTDNIPTTAGSILVNYWSDTNSWSDGPTANDAVVQIGSIQIYSDRP